MATFSRFDGNCPRNVAKDAKYSVRTGKEGSVIAITYRAEEDERWYATTEKHPELVRMVNAVKLSLGLPPNGSFYINEYKQVIVPTAASDAYFLAGRYEQPLRFEFEGKTLSGEAIDLEGNPLAFGDTWTGPHPGIPYVLAAGGDDIRYTIQPRPNVEKDVKLSKMIGFDAAQSVAATIRSVKGFPGGRFYVNEFRAVFAPIQEGRDWRYVYVGQLDLAAWFPEPHAPLAVSGV
jgi:hypothetical protein